MSYSFLLGGTQRPFSVHWFIYLVKLNKSHYWQNEILRRSEANSFEIKEPKITDYYGVDLEIVDLDYTKDAEKIFTKLKDTFKSQHLLITNFNH